MDQSMKVLFCVRHNFYSSPGGAQIQILKTVEGLEKLGVAGDLVSSLEKIDFSRYDLIHLTDLTWTYDLLEYLSVLRNVRIPKVLSTIYWPFDDYAFSKRWISACGSSTFFRCTTPESLLKKAISPIAKLLSIT